MGLYTSSATMFRYSVLILVSFFLSASVGVLVESIRGSAKDEQEVRELATSLDEVIGDEAREFMFYVRLSTDNTLEQMRSCVDRDAFDMGAIILLVWRTAFMDFPVSFNDINFLRNESGRRTEEGHRQLGKYGYSGRGCTKCRSNNGDRRELAAREFGSYTVGDLTNRMERALNVAIKHTFLEIRKDSCLSGLNIKLKTLVELYE
jgi:hypothetical protein